MDIRIPDNDDSLNTFVANLNTTLDKLDLEVVPFVDAPTGNQVYILVRSHCRLPFLGRRPNDLVAQANRKGDDIAQVASNYSPTELSYFKILVRLSLPLSPQTSC